MVISKASTIASVDLVETIKSNITCANCQACCCRLEDGWCSALDQDTIYEHRPWICREFEMGSYECEVGRSENI